MTSSLLLLMKLLHQEVYAGCSPNMMICITIKKYIKMVKNRLLTRIIQKNTLYKSSFGLERNIIGVSIKIILKTLKYSLGINI